MLYFDELHSQILTLFQLMGPALLYMQATQYRSQILGFESAYMCNPFQKPLARNKRNWSQRRQNDELLCSVQ